MVFFFALSFKLSLVSTNTVPFSKTRFCGSISGGEGRGGVTGVPFLELLSVAGKARWWSHEVSLGVTFSFSLEFNWILIRAKFALWLRRGGGRLLGPGCSHAAEIGG